MCCGHMTARVMKPKDKKEETEFVKTALRANGYPEWAFKIPKKKPKAVESHPGPRPKSINIGLPYIRGTSETLQRIFKNHGVSVYHQPSNNLRNVLTKVKDKTEHLKNCDVIYHIKCNDCHHDYIGETGRQLDTRIKEHITRSSSAIYEHLKSTGHTEEC